MYKRVHSRCVDNSYNNNNIGEFPRVDPRDAMRNVGVEGLEGSRHSRRKLMALMVIFVFACVFVCMCFGCACVCVCAVQCPFSNIQRPYRFSLIFTEN